MGDQEHSIRIQLHYQHAHKHRGKPEQQAFTLAVDILLPGNGITAIFGPSGCGKTTLLRCIAGLEKAQGQIQVNGEYWQDGHQFLPCHRRPLAYVFQESSLFPHLSARDNLGYAQKRADKGESPQDYQHLIRLLDLNHLLDRKPHQLSGGERQRVAIARALLIQPQVLLMDEPLASLDSSRKQEILPYLLKLKNELAIPIIYVSHDADEVARLADHIVVMDKGQVITAGPLAETLNNLDFPLQLGEDTGSVIEGTISAWDERWQLAKVAFDGGELWLSDHHSTIDKAVRIRILAKDVSLALAENRNSSIVNLLPARIVAIAMQPDEPMALIKIKTGNVELLARLTRRSVHQLELETGSPVWAQIKSAALIR